jgi:hypothetical protein
LPLIILCYTTTVHFHLSRTQQQGTEPRCSKNTFATQGARKSSSSQVDSASSSCSNVYSFCSRFAISHAKSHTPSTWRPRSCPEWWSCRSTTRY